MAYTLQVNTWRRTPLLDLGVPRCAEHSVTSPTSFAGVQSIWIIWPIELASVGKFTVIMFE